MKNIVIIGAGQLGSRHLQALAAVTEKLSIQVVDPSTASLDTAKQRFDEVAKAFNGIISYHPSIAEVNKTVDVAIIATNSKIRQRVIEELTDHAAVQFLILEKFLFPVMQAYDLVKERLEQKKIRTWVNCPRRMMNFYQELRNELNGNIHLSLTGGLWGMGCNGIHFLDLFAFLTGSTAIELSGQEIDKQILESKREGYIEFTGSISGTSKGHTFRITSSPDIKNTQLIICTNEVIYTIQEGPTAQVEKLNLQSKAVQTSDFQMPFQSQLTSAVVMQLLQTGDCELTPYNDSAALHKTYLNTLLSFLRTVYKNNSINECPIT